MFIGDDCINIISGFILGWRSVISGFIAKLCGIVDDVDAVVADEQLIVKVGIVFDGIVGEVWFMNVEGGIVDGVVLDGSDCGM